MFNSLQWLLIPLEVLKVRSDSAAELLCGLCAMTPSRPVMPEDSSLGKVLHA